MRNSSRSLATHGCLDSVAFSGSARGRVAVKSEIEVEETLGAVEFNEGDHRVEFFYEWLRIPIGIDKRRMRRAREDPTSSRSVHVTSD